MKKLILGLMLLSGLTFFACTEKSNDLDGELKLNTPVDQIVANENSIENSVETTDYESDLYSLGIAVIADYNSTLKSGDLMAQNRFQYMFQNLLKFQNRYKNGQFPNITFNATNNTYPITLVIDYGEGLELNNGRVLSGKITITLSAAPFVSGSTRVVTYDDFTCDGIHVTGTCTKTRTKETQKIFSEVSDLTITLPLGTVIERNEERKKTWTSGSDTQFDPSDDVIEITGIVQVSNSVGDEYTRRITEPLIRTGVCKFITKGVIEFSSNGIIFATIDYGDGECDNKATKTNQNGETVEITLGKV